MNAYSFNSEFAVNSVPLDRKERHRLLRKADILRAAEHVFALKGFYKATIQDIARQAQYATGTVYLYFQDKDALYFSIIEEKISQFLHVLSLKMVSSKGGYSKLEIYICESLNFFEKDHDFFRIFVQGETRWSIKNKLAKLTIFQKRKDYFVELVKEAQSEGAVRQDLEARQISDILDSIIITFVYNWLGSRTRQVKDLKGMTGIIMDLFFNGVKKN